MNEVTQLTHADKIEWMHRWAVSNKAQLVLEGEVGFSRECVGLSTGDKYPDYEWYNDDYDRIDDNGEVWTPEDAYHKHPCVAVLGRGVDAEAQLYEWLKWFDSNGFTVETGKVELKDRPQVAVIRMILGQGTYARMVKRGAP